MLGDIKVFDSQMLRWKPDKGEKKWKTGRFDGAGLLYDLGSHLIDQALALFGMPKAVFADIRVLRPGVMADDYFELILYYNTLKVNLRSSLLANDPGHRFIVQGDKACCIKFGIDSQEALLQKGQMPEGKNWGKEDGSIWATIQSETENYSYPSVTGSYMEYFDNLYSVIRCNSDLIVKPEEARDVIKIIEIAQQSQQQRRIIDVV